jgi:hypothetical protein
MSETAMTGGCACGAIRYQSSEPPRFSFHCQCRQCQRATGGGHASAFILAAEAVKITGEITFYDRPSDSGHTVSQGFCAKCGSPVMNKNAGYPDSRYFHAATLDDPSLFRPERVLFRDASQPWDHIDPDLP